MSDGSEDNMNPPTVTESPEFIWLQYGEIEQDCTHAECSRDGDVTWCEDAQFDSDVRYVRADIYKAQADELDRLRARVAELEAQIAAPAAAAAAAALIAEPRWDDCQTPTVYKLGGTASSLATNYAKASYAMADAMLAAREAKQ